MIGVWIKKMCLQAVSCHCLRINNPGGGEGNYIKYFVVVLVQYLGYRCGADGADGRRLRVASGATAPGPALEGAPRFRPMSLSSYILR